MTVRRLMDETKQPWVTVDWWVEHELSEDPEEFLGAVSRSEVDWSWRAVQ